MKIVKKKKWHQKKANKKLSYKFKKNKNVILYLKKICLCIGMIIFWQTRIINAKEKINNKSKTKVCLCCIGKKENLYIADFINHYQKLGYNHIYLYDNNNIDEERFDEVIKDKINSGFVTVMNYRGYRGRKDDAQMDAYYDCYHRYNSECN